jgi:hypothetical protein
MVTVGLALATLLAAGCASTRDVATQKMSTAERAVGEATQSEAALLATPELKSSGRQQDRRAEVVVLDETSQAPSASR